MLSEDPWSGQQAVKSLKIINNYLVVCWDKEALQLKQGKAQEEAASAIEVSADLNELSSALFELWSFGIFEDHFRMIGKRIWGAEGSVDCSSSALRIEEEKLEIWHKQINVRKQQKTSRQVSMLTSLHPNKLCCAVVLCTLYITEQLVLKYQSL